MVSVVAKRNNIKDSFTLIVPSLISSFHLIYSTQEYENGYTHAINTFMWYSAIVVLPIMIYGLVIRIARKYDTKNKREHIDKGD